MTISATGRRAAFTLIEILVVISLLIVLIAAFVANMLSVGQKAYVSSTRTLFRRLDLGMDTYRERVGFYPADGYDMLQDAGGNAVGSVVMSREGVEIKGGACLYEKLGRPLTVEKPAPGGRKIVERYSSPILSFRQAELDFMADNPTVAEVTDAWGTPIHYDRLEGEESYSRQDDPANHVNPPEQHPPDPREIEATARVIGQGQNQGKYDLWSHGLPGHGRPEEVEEGAAQSVVSNWQRVRE